MGSTSPRSPHFSKTGKKIKKSKDPETGESTLKVEEISHEKSKLKDEKHKEGANEKDKGNSNVEEEEEEEEEEEKDYVSMTLEELISELESWYHDLSFSLDGLDSSLTDEVRNFITGM